MIKRSARSHYKVVGEKLIEKKQYETELDALTVARFINTQPDAIHKSIAYKCIKCGKWHIGTTDKELTEKDREHAEKMLKQENHWVKR